jgi:CDP-diacylglycerol--glycerol-3-phosphate 3-phosphatidyltransferase
MFRNVNESTDRLSRPIRKSPTDLAHEAMAVLFAPLAKLLHRLKITPNTITTMGCLLSLVGAALIATGHWSAAVAVIVFAGLLDGVDGLLARQSQQTSRFGAFLDSVLDRWSDSALFIGLLIWFAQSSMVMQEVLSAVALASSLLVSYTRARAEGIGAECRGGLFTRLERFIVLVAGLVLDQMTIALWIVAVLSTLTSLQRIYYTWQYVKANPED